MKKILFVFIAILLLTKSYAQEKKSAINRYVKTPTGYLMVLREGDSIFEAMEQLAEKEQIPSANFYGMGFAGSVTFGFYDYNKKQFNPKEFKRVEMGSLTGSIGWTAGKPSLHIHGVATDQEFKAYGGHVLAMVVGTGSMEITVTVHSQKLERKIEQPLNANVLQLDPEE
ncbi:DNA-binding protein [Pedobacter sp. PLR]|uniref:PPC domain-containing DNA-binding protein n=1 Tax=Pedobacter sp. PLR TaxID=2994465 RepID=UPI0022470F1E|nr:PPC domain-containing DNA-binding protein [Pedobacter sp. PLR]MCX2453841.1 DNA-binding protein [Pedobacter sp. PLR]